MKLNDFADTIPNNQKVLIYVPGEDGDTEFFEGIAERIHEEWCFDVTVVQTRDDDTLLIGVSEDSLPHPSDFMWPILSHDYDSLKVVHKFTDLQQITADDMWGKFDQHYNCVDTLPLYVSDDWNLIISPAADILNGLHWGDGDWSQCWCFEWAIHDATDDTWDGFLAAYNLSSPWEAFRVAMRYRDAFFAGDDDGYDAI